MIRKISAIYIILVCCLCLQAQNSKLSPYVRQAMVAEHSLRHKSKAIDGKITHTPAITAFVRTTDTNILIDNDCYILAQWDDICIASIPQSKIEKLASMKQIKRIEAGESCMITNNETSRITRVQDVWNYTPSSVASTPISGTGVVVGIMDIGFDLTHPTFYSSDHETYRIKQLWDQLDFTDGGTSVGEGYVGRQYTTQAELLQKTYTADGLSQTHGTHTAGTAAGSGLYSGMAPGADICLVANYTGNNKDIVPEEDRYKYTTATDMLGFKYIFDYAESQGKPCVINFSEGAHDDLYESGLYQEVLSKMLGPGKILCASAGNESAGDGTYMHKSQGEDNKKAFIAKWASNVAGYVMNSAEPVNICLSFYQNNAKIREWNYDAANLANYPDSVFSDTVRFDNQEVAILVNTYPSCFDESKYATDFFVIDLHNNRYGYAIPTLLTISGTDNDIEVYSAGGYFIQNTLMPDLNDYDNTHNILFPGSAKDVVCVGATAHVQSLQNIYGYSIGNDYGKDGKRSSFSSVGPTISGLTKPDVMAPGCNIISSFSSYWRQTYPDDTDTTDDVERTDSDGRTYPWGIESGTSMSTPCVTGIIALWLQVCPTLSPDDVKEILTHTSTHPETSLTYPNNEYGWGEINALAGIQYIETVYTGIEDLTSKAVPSVANYTIYGRRINSLNNQHGIFIVTENGTARKIIR